jgi:hypothetical protein
VTSPALRTFVLRLATAGAALWLTAAPAVAQSPPQAGATAPGNRAFGIARLKYGGGGDWYGNASSLVNLMRAVRQHGIPVSGDKEAVVEPGAAALFQYPFVWASGHGNIKFTDAEVLNLRRYLDSGGFLWVDDDFGLEPSLRRELRRIFPETPLVELPFSHPIFHGLYSFPSGLPKIHEHSGGPPHAWGVVRDGRLVVLFTHDTDIGDGLEDEEVHRDAPDKRDAAIRFALNVVHFALTQ